MPPLSSVSAEKQPGANPAEEELRQQKSELYDELLRSIVGAFDAAEETDQLRLINPEHGTGPEAVETPKATFKVDGQPPQEHTRAWLRKYPRGYSRVRSPIEIVTDTVRVRKGVPKVVEGSEQSHIMVRNAATRTMPLELLDTEATKLLEDANETVGLIKQAIGEQALRNI